MAGSRYRQQLMLDILAWAREATPAEKDRVVEILVAELGAAVAGKVETLVVEIVAEIAEKVATQATATTTTTGKAGRTTMAATTDGWVLVPREPTEEMMVAGCAIPGVLLQTGKRMYHAMLSAAPPPSVSTVGELPDDLRIPLHELQADREWLVARLRNADDEEAALLSESIRNRLSQIEEAAYRLSARAALGEDKP